MPTLTAPTYWTSGEAAMLLGVREHAVKNAFRLKKVPDVARVGRFRLIDLPTLRKLAEVLKVELPAELVEA